MKTKFGILLSSLLLLTAFSLTGCGGSSSNSGGTGNNPVTPTPGVISISPTSVVAGSGPVTLTVTGTNFESSTTIQVGGAAVVTTYVSATQVTAVVPAAQTASGGQLSVIALNGVLSSGAGAPVNLLVTNPAPTITQLSPTTLTTFATNLTVVVTGTGFVPTTVIDVNGSARTTVYVSGTQVNATLTAADIATTGSLSVTAVNPTPGGGTSTAAAVAVNNPVPGPIKLSPALVLTGATSPTAVTVTGIGFIPTSVIEVNGVSRATTYVSSTQLTFQLTVADQASAQTFQVAVVNPSPGGGTTPFAALAVAAQTPTPVITSVSPTQFYVSSSATMITVSGTNLFSTGFPYVTSAVMWNTTELRVQTRCYGCDGANVESITAAVPASLLSSAGTASITVNSPTSTPAVSNSITVTITTAPVPTLTSIVPNTGIINTAASVTLTGTGFAPDSTAAVNGTSISTQYVSSTELLATIPAASVPSAGTVDITVTTPAPGGGTSGSVPFTVTNPPPPVLTSIYPSSGPIQTAANLTLYGTAFATNSTVAINGITVPSTLVNSTELTVAVPASSVAVPGNLNVTVSTPAPGGGTSAAVPYTAYVAITSNDLVYRPADGLLYVSVPSSAGAPTGNSIVGVDPLTGNIVRQIAVGSNPNKLALSSDGTQMFVGVDGAAAVAQVNLNTGQMTNQFSLGGGNGVYNPPNTAAYLAAVPGAPNSVAVAATGSVFSASGVTVYDSGVARAKTSGSLGFGDGPLAFGSSASTLYMLGYSTVSEMTVGASGITGGSNLATVNGYNTTGLQYDNGNLYLSNGSVLNGSTGALLGTFYQSPSNPANGPVVSDSALGLAFIGESSFVPAASAVLAFNESSFNPAGSIPFNGANGASLMKIVRWGQNGVALITSSRLFVFQSPVVNDLSASPTDLSVTLSAPAAATTGTAISYVATVKNNGPNQALGTAVSVSLDPSLIVNSITPSVGSCGSGNTFTCDLGNLTNASSATITVSAVPTTAGTIEGSVSVSSVSSDLTSTNNQATASTAVSGSTYNSVPSVALISPALVEAGSGTFTLTVTGTGFDSSSTVSVGGAAQPTTFVSSTQLTANVDSSAVANYGWAPVTVTNPSPGGGTSGIAPLTIYALLNVPANDMVFDVFSQKLYASVPSASNTVTGNSIVAINPVTAVVGTPVAVGSEPNVLAETTDGNYLWVGLSGANSLAQFDLVHQTVKATIPISVAQFGSTVSAPATWLAAMPGSNTTLAMGVTNVWGNWGIFDVSGSSGSFRSNFSGIYSGVNPSFASATEIYAYDSQTSGAEFYRYSVNANGVALIDGTTLNGLGGFSGSFVLADGTVYGGAGGIINPSTTPPSQIAVLPPVDFYQQGISSNGVATAPDPSTQKEFLMLVNSAGTWEYALARYDLTRYLPEAYIQMPASLSAIVTDWTMLRFGQDGLALLYRPNATINSGAVAQIVLLRGPFVTPQELGTGTAASLSSSSATNIAHGSGNTLLTLTGSNFQPGVAVTWNGSYRTTTIVDATHLTVAIPGSDLASTGNGALVATNPGAPASNTLTVTIN